MLTVRGNPDGQPQTSFGQLDARVVPYVVIPDSFFQHQKVPKNAISAVICDGKVFYAVMGDTNGDKPEVIGEASLLMANTCFPDEHLDGGKGHDNLDVVCNSFYIVPLSADIVFSTEFTKITDTRITDFGALRTLGEQKMKNFIQAIGHNREELDQL